ncbi:hypothetical protein AB0L41_33450 [Amycolatopsis mediterranei]|uniref:hypothetical protein n=1 Tax=Amycolatopsis mediterranei TaxID=33910 RepID=UPI0034421D66
MNLFRSRRPALAIVALALGVAGCSTPAGPDAPRSTDQNTTADATTAETPPSNPGTEPTGPESPRTGDHGVAISIPELPIGGNANPAGQEKLCADASWLQPETLPAGGVKVSRIQADPPTGFHVGGKCGRLPSCASFTFRTDEDHCSVEVTGSGTAEGAQLKFTGGFTCPPGRESSCRELTARMNPGAIGFSRPETTTEPEAPTTEAPPSSSR